MSGLVQIFLAICGVCEAEGRALRDNSLLLIKKGGYAFLGVCFLGAGLALVLGALYALLAPLMPDWLMLALVGAAALVCALCLFRLSAASTKAAPARDDDNPAMAQAQAGGSQERKEAAGGGSAAHDGATAKDGGKNER